MACSIALLSRNTALDAALNALNSGFLELFSGAVPANADASLGSAVLLATLTFGATAFASASAGTKVANAIAGGTAVAAGTPTFFRAYKSDGTTLVCQGTVGATGADCIISPATIALSAGVSCSLFVVSFSA